MAAFNISLGATADEQDNVPIDSYCPSWTSYSTWEQRQSNAQALADKLRHGAMKNSGCESYLSGVPYFVGVGCPYTWMAGAFYDACVLRYSNESFFPVADLSIGSTITDEGRFYAHDMDRMRKTRQKLISRLSLEAAASSLRFANGSETYMDPQSNSQAMFGLVQCSRDLAPSECTKCAEDAHIWMIEHYPNSTAASIKGYSCYVRYTTDPMEITTPPPGSVLLSTFP
nr:cysteine-rich repeat secretory protein 4-like [Aegilops tauschii subsp. strangulata]